MDYYSRIKNLIEEKEVNTKVRILKENNDILQTYFEIGKLIYEAQNGNKRAKYGENIIKQWSMKLQKEFGKAYSFRNLRRMRQFYIVFQKWPTLSTKLNWSLITEVLKFKNSNEMNYYINLAINQNLSVRALRKAIKEKSFERATIENKDNIKLITQKNEYKPKLSDMLKDPVIIEIDTNENINEKVLRRYIIKEIEHIFLELGYGFSYVGSEYKIKVGNKNYYIDLLLYNIKLNCYIVIELKTRNFLPKDVGQINFYMNYIDENIKEDFNNSTEGIILCKENDKLILKYISNDKIKIINYIISNNKIIK